MRAEAASILSWHCFASSSTACFFDIASSNWRCTTASSRSLANRAASAAPFSSIAISSFFCWRARFAFSGSTSLFTS
uniref:Putative secreted protein n=1 Tax=Anopheles darlingi TaxID=43151 RepID=A0A2M4D8R4_ANODA